MPKIYDATVAGEKMDAWLKANEPKVARWLHDTWNAQKGQLKFEEIVEAAASGEITPAVLTRWRQDYARFILERLDPLWRKEFEVASKNLLKQVNLASTTELIFSEQWLWIRQYIESQGGELITNLTAVQKEAINAVLRHYITEELVSAQELARILRANIGMTRPHATAWIKYRGALQEEGLRGSKLQGMLQRRENYYIKYRAENIARTELARAWGHSQRQTMGTAINKGLFPGKNVWKEWMTAGDERVCGICGPMDGESVHYDEVYSAGVIFPSEVHPSCRCDESYITRAMK